MKQSTYRPPFSWFGGKRLVAANVWQRFGIVDSYIEPFAGGCAVGLANPNWRLLKREVYNDKDGLLINCWRAIKSDPARVWFYANRPRSHIELRAWWRKIHQELTEPLERQLENDPEYYDVKIAGIWLWGVCASIGNRFVLPAEPPTVSVDASGILRRNNEQWLELLAERLQTAIFVNRDWKSAIWEPKSTATVGIFLDPPYVDPTVDIARLYRKAQPLQDEVLEWCKQQGNLKKYRIAVCGYNEYDELAHYGWEKFQWTAIGGWKNRARAGNRNRHRETIWFSPHCLPAPAENINRG